LLAVLLQFCLQSSQRWKIPVYLISHQSSKLRCSSFVTQVAISAAPVLSPKLLAVLLQFCLQSSQRWQIRVYILYPTKVQSSGAPVLSPKLLTVLLQLCLQSLHRCQIRVYILYPTKVQSSLGLECWLKLLGTRMLTKLSLGKTRFFLKGCYRQRIVNKVCHPSTPENVMFETRI
jgi:hypothetical protein